MPGTCPLFVVTSNRSRSSCLGPLIRSSVSFGSDAFLTIGSDPTFFSGAHGSERYIALSRLGSWADVRSHGGVILSWSNSESTSPRPALTPPAPCVVVGVLGAVPSSLFGHSGLASVSVCGVPVLSHPLHVRSAFSPTGAAPSSSPSPSSSSSSSSSPSPGYFTGGYVVVISPTGVLGWTSAMRDACDVFVHAVVSDFFLPASGDPSVPPLADEPSSSSSDDDDADGGEGSAAALDHLSPPPVDATPPPSLPPPSSFSGVPLASLPDVLLPEALLSLCLSHLCGHLATLGVVQARPIVGAKFVKDSWTKGCGDEDDVGMAENMTHEDLTKALKDTRGAKALREEREKNRLDLAAAADLEELSDALGMGMFACGPTDC